MHDKIDYPEMTNLQFSCKSTEVLKSYAIILAGYDKRETVLRQKSITKSTYYENKVNEEYRQKALKKKIRKNIIGILIGIAFFLCIFIETPLSPLLRLLYVIALLAMSILSIVIGSRGSLDSFYKSNPDYHNELITAREKDKELTRKDQTQAKKELNEILLKKKELEEKYPDYYLLIYNFWKNCAQQAKMRKLPYLPEKDIEIMQQIHTCFKSMLYRDSFGKIPMRKASENSLAELILGKYEEDREDAQKKKEELSEALDNLFKNAYKFNK